MILTGQASWDKNVWSFNNNIWSCLIKDKSILKVIKTQLVQVLFSYKYQLDTLCLCNYKRP